MLLLARSRVSKKINLLPLCGFIHSNQMLICSGFYSNSSQSYIRKESLGNESLGVCFAFCIRKGKKYTTSTLCSQFPQANDLSHRLLFIKKRWSSEVDNSYFPPETCRSTTTRLCARDFRGVHVNYLTCTVDKKDRGPGTAAPVKQS